MTNTDDRRRRRRGEPPSPRDKRPFSAVLCVWVLVSERGLEPPRGYTPHQVLSLTSTTVPSGTSAPRCHSSHLSASPCKKVEMVVLVRGALRVPRQETRGIPSSGIRSISAPGLQPRVALPWSPALVQLLVGEDGRRGTHTDSNQSQVPREVSSASSTAQLLPKSARPSACGPEGRRSRSSNRTWVLHTQPSQRVNVHRNTNHRI